MRTELEIDQNTPEWLEARKGKVTGSNAIVLLQHGFYEAMRRNETGGNSGGGFWADRGHILEDEVTELYEAIYGHKVHRAGIVVNSLYKNAQCSPDGEDHEDDALLEFKCLKPENHLREIKSPAAKYIAQTNFNAVICERKKARLIYYCNDKQIKVNDRFKVIDVTNKNIQANIKRKLREAKSAIQ